LTPREPAPAPAPAPAPHTPGLEHFGADRIQHKIDGLRATIELLTTTGGGSTQELEAELAELLQRHAELTAPAPAPAALQKQWSADDPPPGAPPPQ